MYRFLHHHTPFDGADYAHRINAAQMCLNSVQESMLRLHFTDYYKRRLEPPVLVPPKIVVLGNKEAGKTSLIYTLAHIPITRRIPTPCPVEIQLRRQTTEIEWKCVVSVERRAGQRWNPVDSEETTEIHKVQDILEKALRSVTADFGGQLKTPTSVISIKITGAALDLTLLDLPPLDFVQ